MYLSLPVMNHLGHGLIVHFHYTNCQYAIIVYPAHNWCGLFISFLLSFWTGLREWFSQTDERNVPARIPVMVNMSSTSNSTKNAPKAHDSCVHPTSVDQMSGAGRHSVMLDEYSDEDEDLQIAESEQEVCMCISISHLWCRLRKF